LLLQNQPKSIQKLILTSLSIHIPINSSNCLESLLLIESGRIAHHLEHLVEKSSQLVGIEGAGSVSIEFLEDLRNELAELLLCYAHLSKFI